MANLFTLPFAKNVWVAIGIFCLLLLVLLYVSMKWEWDQIWRMSKAERDYILRAGYEIEKPSVSEDLLVIVGAVSQQGSYYEPRSVATRIVVLMALIATITLYAAYSANIVALLQSTSSISSLKELYDSPLTLAAHDTVYNRFYFKVKQLF